jgi:putative transposase
MPSRNVVKQYGEEQFYHVYNRGVNKQLIFNDKEDYVVFMALLKRYLSAEDSLDNRGNVYDNYSDKIELNAFCLMPNHFHLLLFLNKETGSITELLRKVSGSYTKYYNKRHNRVGHLFQGIFKASRITNDPYLQHISRYIHLNPRNYKEWEYSSLPYYLNSKKANWVKPDRIMSETTPAQYETFMDDFSGYKKSLDDINYQLADR